MSSISVIIPVHNVEKYIDATLRSLINQTIFEMLDIILIDDGSTDKSKEICGKYAREYSNIRLISQENKGVSSARNKGLEESCSLYVAFCDADDIVKPKMYERLLQLIEKNNADISMIDFSFVREGIEYKRRDIHKFTLENNKDIMKKYLSGNIFTGNIIDKLYKKGALLDVKFEEGFRVGEDYYFLYNVLKNINKIEVDTTESYYNYIVRENSAMTKSFDDRYFDTIILAEKVVEDCKETDLYNYALAHLIHEQCKVVEYMYLNNADEKYKKKEIELLKNIKKYSLLEGFKYLSKRQFIGLILMKMNPKIYLKVFKLVNGIRK